MVQLCKDHNSKGGINLALHGPPCSLKLFALKHTLKITSTQYINSFTTPLVCTLTVS